MSNNKRTPLAERFWPRVDIRSDDECWPWTGAVSRRSGHGSISVNGRGGGMEGTHRVAYLLTKGSIDGVYIRHTCDNPPCCNPAHLLAGTQDDNMRDMAERERSRTTKLTASQVYEIRRRSKERHRDLAVEFGVSKANISMIVTRKTWKHLPLETFARPLEGGAPGRNYQPERNQVMSTITKFVPAEEREIAMGVFASSPAHWVVTAGEYADQGEADIDVRILGACDAEGNDISEAIASAIAAVIEEATTEESK